MPGRGPACEHAGVRDDGEGVDRHLPIDPDLDPADAAEPSDEHVPRPAGAAGPRRAEPSVLAAIAAGGALGAPARYAVTQVVGVSADGFPWATFWTNVSGSFALGFLLVVLIRRYPPSHHLRPFVATGFLGAFTTFSTFVVETDLLVDHGHGATAAAYVTASLAAGLAASWAGIAGGRRVSAVSAGAPR